MKNKSLKNYHNWTGEVVENIIIFN